MIFKKGDLVLINRFNHFQLAYIFSDSPNFNYAYLLEIQEDGIRKFYEYGSYCLTLIERASVEIDTDSLGITRAIRKFFGDREMRRIAGFKNETKHLRQKVNSLEGDNFNLRTDLIRLKRELRKLIE